MLNRSQRLSTAQLEEVMEKGRVHHSPFFILRALAAPGPVRISAVVSKKVSKTAVGRNRMRRRMYEVIRPIYPAVNEGMHIIFFAKDAALEADPVILASDIKALLAKARLMK